MTTNSPYAAAPWRQWYPAEFTSTDNIAQAANLPALLTEAAARWGAQTAFTTCMPNGMSGRLSFQQVAAEASAFAVWLRARLNLSPGSRVAVQLPNCLSYPVVAFGVLQAGCVLVNINPMYSPREVTQQLNDSGAEVLVTLDLLADKVAQIIPQTQVRQVVLTQLGVWFPPLVRGILHGVLRYWQRVVPKHTLNAPYLTQVLAEGHQIQHQQQIDSSQYWQQVGRDDLALLQYTGGTTGVAKGAMLSHGNLLHNLAQVTQFAGGHIRPGQECILTALPLYHIFAFTVNLLAFYVQGAHNVLVPNPRPIRNCQRALENFPISWISGVNTLFNALLNEEWFVLDPPPHLRVALAGGTALQGVVAERWQRLMGLPISEGYGLTEASPVVSFNRIGEERPNSIGIPVPNTDIIILNKQGHPAPLGEPGELAVRGPQVMQGYWQRPEDTLAAMHEGYLLTGDIACMEASGHLSLVDRKKDLILVSGFNVYPSEVEAVIAQLDAVQEAAVVGQPDAQTGESVQAFVQLRTAGLTKADVIAHCRAELAAYKVPKTVVFCADLPRTPVGKVLRRALRQTGDASC